MILKKTTKLVWCQKHKTLKFKVCIVGVSAGLNHKLLSSPLNKIFLDYVKNFSCLIIMFYNTFRTLVVPKFHGHYLYPGTFLPHQIIDVKRLCEFVSCISVEELKKYCGDSFEVVFQVGLNNFCKIFCKQ